VDYIRAYHYETNDPPDTEFSYTTEFLDVDFTDASLDYDGSVESWDWNFGDTNSSTSQNPTHSYASEGSYDVSLQAYDDDGASSTVTKTINVTDRWTTADDFEDGDTAEWTVNEGTASWGTSSTSYEGSYSGHSSVDLSTDNAIVLDVTSSPWQGGKRLDILEFYWRESTNQTDWQVFLINSNGNKEAKLSGNNPQWEAEGDQFYSGDGYDRWIKFEVDFNWANQEYTVTGTDQQSGSVASTTKSLRNGEDIETVWIGGGGSGSSTQDFYLDYLRGAEPGDPLALTDYADVGTSDATTADLYGTADRFGDESSGEIAFDWGPRGSVTANQTAWQSISSTGQYMHSISGLTEGNDYDFRAKVQTSDGDLDNGSTQTFTAQTEWTDDFESYTAGDINPDGWTGVGDNLEVSNTRARNSLSATPSSGTSASQHFEYSQFSNAQYTLFRFWFNETSNNSVVGFRVNDENGNQLFGIYSDNPTVTLYGNSGNTSINSGNYDTWYRVDCTLDWANSNVTGEVFDANGNSKGTATDSFRSGGTALAQIVASDEWSGNWSTEEAWVDNIRVE
jgi:PKD repeat protein